MKMAVARVSVGSAVPALLVALLACATARVAVVAGGTACDGVNCGIGTCKELPATPLPVPAYECDCEAGWSRIVSVLPFTPCFIPTCQSDLSCYSPTLKVPPIGSNVTQHPCLVMDCGREGTCVEGPDKPFFHCQCNAGATNVLNNPSLPCTKNCVIGQDGCPVPNPPPPPPPPSSPPPPLSSPPPPLLTPWTAPPPPSSAAPPGNGTDPTSPSSSVGNSAVPASPGSVCLQNLLLLLASLAALYIV